MRSICGDLNKVLSNRKLEVLSFSPLNIVIMSSQHVSGSNDRFNAEAAAWDSNPDVHRASSLALQSILDRFPQLRNRGANNTTGLDVLEIGCGTGLLSFMIAPYVRSLTAIDTAQGMIGAFKLKLARQPEVQNVLPVCVMLEDSNDPRIGPDPLSKDKKDVNEKELPPRRFDLITSHLVLHHIPSLESIFSTMHGCLKLGGSVALTDFEDFGPEARKFHPEAKMDGVERHGIQRDSVRKLLTDAGFTDVRIETAFKMEKRIEISPGEGVVKGENGCKMTFPFLICMAQRA